MNKPGFTRQHKKSQNQGKLARGVLSAQQIQTEEHNQAIENLEEENWF